jgi:hypothetical protein
MRQGISIEVSDADRERLAAGCGGSRQSAEACLSGTDQPGNGEEARDGGGLAPRWGFEVVHLATAGPVHTRRRVAGFAAREDQKSSA